MHKFLCSVEGAASNEQKAGTIRKARLCKGTPVKPLPAAVYDSKR
jgi:hypothetical protein